MLDVEDLALETLRVRMVHATEQDRPDLDRLLRAVPRPAARSRRRPGVRGFGAAALVAAVTTGAVATSAGGAPQLLMEAPVYGGSPVPARTAPLTGPDDATLRTTAWLSFYSQSTGPSAFRRRTFFPRHGQGLVTQENPEPMVLPQPPFQVGRRRLTWDQVAALPTQQESLAALLAIPEDGAPSDQQLFDGALYALFETPAPSSLRAALVGVLERTPGALTTPATSDSVGRPAVEIDLTTNSSHTQVFADATTGRLLEWAVTTTGTTIPTSAGGPPAAPPAQSAGWPTGSVARFTILAQGTQPPSAELLAREPGLQPASR